MTFEFKWNAELGSGRKYSITEGPAAPVSAVIRSGQNVLVRRRRQPHHVRPVRCILYHTFHLDQRIPRFSFCQQHGKSNVVECSRNQLEIVSRTSRSPGEDFVKPNPRTPRRLYERLQRIATREHRSLTDQIVKALEEHADREDKK